MLPVVLVTGEHRSGTTLLAELLDAQPQVTVLADFLHLDRYARALGGLRLDAELDGEAKERLLAQFTRDNDALARVCVVPMEDFDTLLGFYELVLTTVAGPDDVLVGHKSTRAYPQTIRLLRHLPHLRVVVCLRDPRSAVVSELARLQTSAWAPLVAKWRECAAFVAESTADPLLQNRVHVVRFEQLVAAPQQALAPLADFLGLDGIDPGQLVRTGGGRSGNSSFGLLEGGRIDASPRDRWRQNEHLSACVARRLGSEMVATGYGLATEATAGAG